jgi:hypothetical protein
LHPTDDAASHLQCHKTIVIWSRWTAVVDVDHGCVMLRGLHGGSWLSAAVHHADLPEERDRFLFALLWDSGVRIGETLGLRHADIPAAAREVTIVSRANDNGARTKSRASRSIPVSAELVRLYADYLHGEYGDLDSDYVFVNLCGRADERTATCRLRSRRRERRTRPRAPLKTTPYAGPARSLPRGRRPSLRQQVRDAEASWSCRNGQGRGAVLPPVNLVECSLARVESDRCSSPPQAGASPPGFGRFGARHQLSRPKALTNFDLPGPTRHKDSGSPVQVLDDEGDEGLLGVQLIVTRR